MYLEMLYLHTDGNNSFHKPKFFSGNPHKYYIP